MAVDTTLWPFLQIPISSRNPKDVHLWTSTTIPIWFAYRSNSTIVKLVFTATIKIIPATTVAANYTLSPQAGQTPVNVIAVNVTASNQIDLTTDGQLEVGSWKLTLAALTVETIDLVFPEQNYFYFDSPPTGGAGGGSAFNTGVN